MQPSQIMRRRVTFEPTEPATIAALPVVQPPMWRQLVLAAMACFAVWRTDAMAAALTLIVVEIILVLT